MPTLDDIMSLVVSDAPDVETEKDIAKAEIEKQQIINEGLRLAIGLRKKYAVRIFAVTVIWLVYVASLLVYCGLNWLMLSDAVLIALITTTTINVLGILAIVVRYLFPTGIER